MSVAKTSQGDFSKSIDAFFVTSLWRLHLTQEQIDQQDLSALQRSLGVVEDALSRAESFGICRIKMTATVSVIISATSDSHFESGITPLLLEAKIKILSRLDDLGVNSHEEEKSILRQQLVTYRFRWLFLLGTVIWIIGSIIMWQAPHLIGWEALTTHKNYISLSSISCVVLGGLIWATLDENKSRRIFAIGSVVVAGLLVGVALL